MNSNSPHPLAIKLSAGQPDAQVLLVGIGSGRNLSPFLKSGHLIIALDESETSVAFFRDAFPQVDVRRYSDARLPVADNSVQLLLATHTMQHGDRRYVRTLIAEFSRVCTQGARIALVFASVNDARYGRGTHLGPGCYAPIGGDEIGVPHIYLTEEEIRRDLARDFEITSLAEVDADAIAGAWAHKEAQGLRHFFVEAQRR